MLGKCPLGLAPQLRQSLRKLAEQAARAGGAVARQSFGSRHQTRRKSDGSEVTEADRAAQEAIVACLRAARPDDDLIAEEGPSGIRPRRRTTPRSRPRTDATGPALCWVVDPLDGTRNFIAGIPLYAVSVAALCDGVPVAGAVYLPEREEMFSSAGDQVLCNGRPLFPRRRRPGSRCLVGIPSSLDRQALTVMRGWPAGLVLRNLGVTSLHLAMVAARQIEAALISDSRLWDIAAGWLLVRAAGGVMTRLDGRDIFPIDVTRYRAEPIPSLASSGKRIHRMLLASRGPQAAGA
jgi:myo-inositol-1(or 4)-monophosphatase